MRSAPFWAERLVHRSTFLIMLIRELAVRPYEFGEVLELYVSERDSRTHALVMLCCIRVPLDEGNFEHYFTYSVNASKDVVPNFISREVFHLVNFLQQKEWKDKLSSYADFCDGKF